MPKKPLNKQEQKVSKKEQNQINLNSYLKNGQNPSSSEMNSEEQRKNEKTQEINSDDEALFQINNTTNSNNQIFHAQILNRFQLQKIDEFRLAHDKSLLYYVTFLGKKDAMSSKKCICTREDMKKIEGKSGRRYRYECLTGYLAREASNE